MSTTAGAGRKKSGYTFLWILIGITIGLAIVAAAVGAQLKVPGFVGTRATLGAGLVVIAEVVMLATLWYGRALAKKKNFGRHKRVQTSVVLFNLVAIGFVMIVTFREQIVGPGATPGDPAVPLAIAHGLGGALLELLGLYIVVRMWFEKQLPQWLLFKNFKLLMLIALYGWTLIAAGGAAIFVLRYFGTPASGVAATAPLPTPAVPSVSGSTGIRDDRTHSDSILITLENVPQPPSGQAYVGWLIGNNGEYRLSIGVLSVEADGKITAEYVSPTGENLFAVYDEFIIAREPIGAAPQAPSDQIAYSAVVPAQARQALNRLLVSAPDIKFGTGYLLNLLLMARRVNDQAGVIQKLANRDDLAGLHRQAEVIVNIIEGEQGKNYGDLDGDGRVLNNGDSLGIWPTDIDRVKEVAQAAIDAPDASAAIKLHAGHVIVGMDNARTWAEQLDVKALELARTQDITAAKTLALDVGALAKKLLEGVDTNNDEVISPIPGEGTIEMAYKHAQFAASPVYQAPITAGGAPLTAAEVTPTPPPTEAPAPTPAPRETIVLMQNFAFTPQTITIKAGAKVMWINQDNAPHTATADDNSFDTGTLSQGQSGSITFDKPGEFPYYCLFHGGPGGVGMAGKIVVTP